MGSCEDDFDQNNLSDSQEGYNETDNQNGNLKEISFSPLKLNSRRLQQFLESKKRLKQIQES